MAIPHLPDCPDAPSGHCREEERECRCGRVTAGHPGARRHLPAILSGRRLHRRSPATGASGKESTCDTGKVLSDLTHTGGLPPTVDATILAGRLRPVQAGPGVAMTSVIESYDSCLGRRDRGSCGKSGRRLATGNRNVAGPGRDLGQARARRFPAGASCTLRRNGAIRRSASW